MSYNVYDGSLNCELLSSNGYQWINTTYKPSSIVYNTNNTPPTSFSITYNFPNTSTQNSSYKSIESSITYGSNGKISIVNKYTCIDNITFTINIVNLTISGTEPFLNVFFDNESCLTINGESIIFNEIFDPTRYLLLANAYSTEYAWGFFAYAKTNPNIEYLGSVNARSATTTFPLKYKYTYELNYYNDTNNPNIVINSSTNKSSFTPAIIYNLIWQIIFGGADIINNYYYKNLNPTYDTKFMGGVWLTSQMNNLVEIYVK
jgi:hypothetical protein